MNIAQAESKAKRRKKNPTKDDYFIATVKTTGEIWLDDEALPHKCSRETQRTVFAEKNGKEMGFCRAIFDFEVTMKGRRQKN